MRYLFPRGGSVPTAKIQPKQYEFIKADKSNFNAIEVDGKVLKLGKKTGAFTTHDPGLANEINARYGWGKGKQGPLIMNTVDTESPRRRVKMFSMPLAPWKRKREADDGIPAE